MGRSEDTQYTIFLNKNTLMSSSNINLAERARKFKFTHNVEIRRKSKITGDAETGIISIQLEVSIDVGLEALIYRITLLPSVEMKRKVNT